MQVVKATIITMADKNHHERWMHNKCACNCVCECVLVCERERIIIA